MLRYIGISWNVADLSQAKAATALVRHVQFASHDWKLLLDVDGLYVLYAGSNQDIHILQDSAGIILGTLFKRLSTSDDPVTPVAAGKLAETNLLDSKGHDLIDKYWGSYVAFLIDPTSKRRYVVRDPLGQIECLKTTFRGISVYVSSLQHCLPLELFRFSLDWEYVACLAAYPMLDNRRTGLREVSRILGGECEESDGDTISRSHYWHPFSFASVDPIDDLDLASKEIRRATKLCVNAWAARYNTIVHRLSGGLDSSIVLSCLGDAPSNPDVTCINYYYSRGSNSDERRFARVAAGHTRYSLIERESSSRYRLEGLRSIPLSASPAYCIYPLGTYEEQVEIVRAKGAVALFDGTGGDEIFYKYGDWLSCADYVCNHGFNLTLFQLALQAARLGRSSVWSVLRNAARDSFRRPLDIFLEKHWPARSLASDEIIHSSEIKNLSLHPWLHSTAQIAPGKFLQAMTLSAPLGGDCILAKPEDPPEISPLLSQPLVELCLQISTYIHVSGAWDRSVARRAFSADIPHEIIRRRSKCVVDEFSKHLLATNIDIAREMLLNGNLMKQKITNNKRLLSMLSGEPLKDDVHSNEVFHLLSLEAWCDVWGRYAHKAAA